MIKDRLQNTLRIAHNLLYFKYISNYCLYFAIVFTLTSSALVYAAPPHIEVIALFENKAMLHIDKERVMVSAGDVTSHGIKLISADANGAVIEFDGTKRRYTLGTVVRGGATSSNGNEQANNTGDIIVYRGTDTLFRTAGSMNGYPVNFLVDTGASSIAINSQEAKRLGINYKLKGEATMVRTASGIEHASSVTIDRVTISGVTLRSVEGLVIEGSEPSVPLLGMSYLSRFNITNDGNMMRLQKKY